MVRFAVGTAARRVDRRGRSRGPPAVRQCSKRARQRVLPGALERAGMTVAMSQATASRARAIRLRNVTPSEAAPTSIRLQLAGAGTDTGVTRMLPE